MQQKQMIYTIIMWVVIIGVFYLLMIRPQKKKEQKLKDMRNSIAKGDTVVTIAGMIAKVAKVEEDRVVLEVGPSRTKIPYEKWAIGRVTEKAAKDESAEDVSETMED